MKLAKIVAILAGMGLEIRQADNGQTELVLTCDGYGCRDRAPQVFAHDRGYIAQYRMAMVAGWKDAFRNGRRVFLGPCCSGKRDGSDRD